MNILVIPDKFKDALPVKKVISAITNGIYKHSKSHQVISIIASDGGDGFLDAIIQVYPNIKKITTKTVNPFGESILALYLFDPLKQTAYIELAEASGLELLKPNKRNCNISSTYGTGLQIKHAIKNGTKNIFIGLGGSATNDGGTGILRALGFIFFDKNKNPIATVGNNLDQINTFIPSSNTYENINFYTVNDVHNLLLGPNGATFTYALQKGAKKSDLTGLEKGMSNLFYCAKRYFPKLKDNSGFGAAGGTCFGLSTFLNAKIISGIDFILDLQKINKILENSKIDLIITGEGKIDKQTLHGKFIKGVLRVSKKYSIPVIAICGVSELDKNNSLYSNQFKVYPIKSKNITTKESIENSAKLIEKKIVVALNNFKNLSL